ncbi:conserved hypothetical protein [Streptomyces sp. SPB074]|nr:conserved hypothetical protein [Streptomyces sp. SPB074]
MTRAFGATSALTATRTGRRLAGEGAPMSGYGAGRTRGTTSGMAIAALVLGIVGLFFFSILPGLLALVFGLVALRGTGRPGMAKAGLVLGVIDLILGIVLMATNGFGLYVGA